MNTTHARRRRRAQVLLSALLLMTSASAAARPSFDSRTLTIEVADSAGHMLECSTTIRMERPGAPTLLLRPTRVARGVFTIDLHDSLGGGVEWLYISPASVMRTHPVVSARCLVRGATPRNDSLVRCVVHPSGDRYHLEIPTPHAFDKPVSVVDRYGFPIDGALVVSGPDAMGRFDTAMAAHLPGRYWLARGRYTRISISAPGYRPHQVTIHSGLRLNDGTTVAMASTDELYLENASGLQPYLPDDRLIAFVLGDRLCRPQLDSLNTGHRSDATRRRYYKECDSIVADLFGRIARDVGIDTGDITLLVGSISLYMRTGIIRLGTLSKSRLPATADTRRRIIERLKSYPEIGGVGLVARLAWKERGRELDKWIYPYEERAIVGRATSFPPPVSPERIVRRTSSGDRYVYTIDVGQASKIKHTYGTRLSLVWVSGGIEIELGKDVQLDNILSLARQEGTVEHDRRHDLLHVMTPATTVAEVVAAAERIRQRAPGVRVRVDYFDTLNANDLIDD